MKDKLLKVTDISKSYRNVNAVNTVSFEVFPGEVLGLLGPNGAGKTSIIRMIMGILKPDSGEISFDGQTDIDKKQLGYLPEERGIYSETKLLDTILYFAELNNIKRKKAQNTAEKWLTKLNLQEYKDKKIETLSKGMQQKVQFIISIIHQPKLLVLDELFSGLDPINQDLFKDIIEELKEADTTILLSSHRMNMVEELCDRIFLINDGQRVLYGNLEEIKESFERKYITLTTEEEIDSNILTDNSFVNDLTHTGDKVKFNINSKVDIRRFLQEIPGEIKELTISNPSLHQIFVNTVKGGDQ